MDNKVEINENGDLTHNGELVKVMKKPEIENDEVTNLLAKIDSIFVKLKTTNLGQTYA